MPFSVNELKSNLVGGGARSSLFSVQFNNPADGTANVKVPFMCRASEIPEARIGQIEVGYYGRKIKVAGDRTYDNWNVTVINDEDFLIRNALETWSNKINSFEGNLRTFSTSSPLQYKADAIITQYSKTGTVLREYTMIGIFPTQIESIPVDWDQTDRIEEFRVNFAYDYWTVSGGTTGNAGGL